MKDLSRAFPWESKNLTEVTVVVLAFSHEAHNIERFHKTKPLLLLNIDRSIIMMKTSDPVKVYDSIEYGLLVPDHNVVVKPRRKHMSWPKCLCITLLVLVAAFIITTTVGALWGYLWIAPKVKRITTSTPKTFPIHEISKQELELLKDRAKLFYDAVRAGLEPAGDLVITQDEINGLVAHSDYLRGNAIVHLTENNFSADMSLPAKFLPGGKGRYLVASGSLLIEPTQEDDQTKITVELETPYQIEGLKYPKLLFGEFLAYIAATDGSKTLNLLSGQFYNWVAPPDYIAKKENLLDHVCDDDDDEDDEDCRDFMTFLDGLEQVSIGDQKITFHARASHQGRRLISENESNDLSEKMSGYGDYARRSLMKLVF